MPKRQRTTPSDDESSIPPTSSSANALNHGRLEVWFEDHEDIIQTFLIEINRKQIIILKVIHMSWLNCFKVFGHGHYKTTCTLSLFIATPSAETVWPR